MSTRWPLTGAQRELAASLSAVMAQHRWSTRETELEVLAGPKTFDVRCCRGAATLWHFIGTAEQIVDAVDRWFTHRKTTHADDFLPAVSTD